MNFIQWLLRKLHVPNPAVECTTFVLDSFAPINFTWVSAVTPLHMSDSQSILEASLIYVKPERIYVSMHLFLENLQVVSSNLYSWASGENKEPKS